MTPGEATPPAATPTEPQREAFARALRGFGPIGLGALILIVPFSGLLGPLRPTMPLLWAWRSRTPLAELGLVRPRSWLRTIGLGIIGGIVFKLLMKTVVMPLLGAPPENAAFQSLRGNTGMLATMLVAVTLGAGFGEELTYRGFLFERIRTLVGDSKRTGVICVIVTSLIFGLIHLPEQHLFGAVQALLMGLVVGTIYAWTRELWLPVILHAVFDVVAVIIIYCGLETRLAHLLFH